MTSVMAGCRARKTKPPGCGTKDGSPAALFSLSAVPFPCFYRVGRLWVIWKQKPWFLKACKLAASNKIFTDLFFLNQTFRLKPSAKETKEQKEEGFSNDFVNSSYNAMQLYSYKVIAL